MAKFLSAFAENMRQGRQWRMGAERGKMSGETEAETALEGRKTTILGRLGGADGDCDWSDMRTSHMAQLLESRHRGGRQLRLTSQVMTMHKAGARMMGV